jgi:hypothetical protein
MTLITSRGLRLAALTALLAALQPDLASAQAAGATTRSSLLDARAAVPEGGVVHVTDLRGKTMTGVLGSVSSEVVEVTVEGRTRAVFAREIQRIQWRQPDSWVTGAAIGACIGAIPGLYYLIRDPNECAGLCPEEYALVGIGGLVGALVDRAITRKITVYENPAKAGRSGNVAVTPVLTRARRGVHVTVTF